MSEVGLTSVLFLTMVDSQRYPNLVRTT